MSAKSEMNKSSKSLFAENIDLMFDEKKNSVAKKWQVESKPKVGFYINNMQDPNPVKISNQLADFLGKKRGVEMFPTDVEKDIMNYIRANNLISTDNYGYFNSNDELIKLFNLTSCQRGFSKGALRMHIKKHFTKPDENIQFKIHEDTEIGSDTDDDGDSDQAIVPEPPLVPIDNINLCFVGGVSTGKSTILNAIFCEELTQCKIKRTTMVPTIYVENENDAENLTSPDLIFTTISDKNKEIIEKTESGKKLDKSEYKELAFNVGKLDINIMNGTYVNVYDIPGLNDARTKDVYYSYLDENFTKFNLVVLLVDIHSGLNTSDEIDIVNFITTHTKYELDNNKKEIYTLVVVNKADDMQLDEEGDEESLKLTGELSEMFEQVEKTITSEFNRHDIKKHLIGIIPLCAIDSYLYRMVKKHGKKFKLSPQQILKIGINENGKKFSTLKPATQEKKVYEILTDENFINTMIKLSGFSYLEKILHKFLNENNTGKKIRIDNLLFEMSKYPEVRDIIIKNKKDVNEIKKHIKKYYQILTTIKTIDPDAYHLQASTLVAKFVSVLEEIIKNVKGDKKNELITYYDEINRQVLQPYFGEFVSQEYPDYMKTHIIDLIHNDFDNKAVKLEGVIENFNILKMINMFNKKEVSQIIEMIILNRLGKYTITNDATTPAIINLITDILDECESLKVDISRFMRFLLINIYNTCDADELYKKQMIYQRHGEIPMQSYLSNIIDKSKLDIHLYINGFDSDISFEKEHPLEMYYILYERKINYKNFINFASNY